MLVRKAVPDVPRDRECGLVYYPGHNFQPRYAPCLKDFVCFLRAPKARTQTEKRKPDAAIHYDNFPDAIESDDRCAKRIDHIAGRDRFDKLSHRTPPTNAPSARYTSHEYDGGILDNGTSPFVEFLAGITLKDRCSHDIPAQKVSTAYAIGAKIAAANNALTTKAILKTSSISVSPRFNVRERCAASVGDASPKIVAATKNVGAGGA